MIWQNCYDFGWQNEIVPESFSHPAKFSRALIRRIYEHAFSEGWFSPGMTVVDPFGGVALGALDAMWNRLNYIGVELEPKFCALAEKNIELWQRKYGNRDGFGTALIFQADSRKLAEVIAGADLVCSSPPYAQALSGSTNQTESDREHRRSIKRNPDSPGSGYPRYYGNSEGQLASIPEGRFESVISSPPWEGCVASMKTNESFDFSKMARNRTEKWGRSGSAHDLATQAKLDQARLMNRDYGNSSGQIGNSFGPTFWSAARDILIQCHTILKPGGHAIFVCKDFVRKGKRVPFSDQWQALCESVGFRLVCRHRAMLVENYGEQETIFEGTEQLRTERKSFFRRLAEKKGSPNIDWEDVICLQKPENRLGCPRINDL